jgi:Helix-turn-helix domain
LLLQPEGKLMSATTNLPKHLRHRREKVFGPARGIPLDRNAKVRIMIYVQGYNARYKQRGQHRGPITRAFMEVLEALLWGFHNCKDGRCFPSYESIATRAKCSRDTVYEAIKALEFANILSWVNRITRIRTRELDLFGKWAIRSRIVRLSNAYVFRDPLPCHEGRPSLRVSSKSENPPETINPELSITYGTPTEPPPKAVKAAQEALARFRHQREAVLFGTA